MDGRGWSRTSDFPRVTRETAAGGDGLGTSSSASASSCPTPPDCPVPPGSDRAANAVPRLTRAGSPGRPELVDGCVFGLVDRDGHDARNSVRRDPVRLVQISGTFRHLAPVVGCRLACFRPSTSGKSRAIAGTRRMGAAGFEPATSRV